MRLSRKGKLMNELRSLQPSDVEILYDALAKLGFNIEHLGSLSWDALEFKTSEILKVDPINPLLSELVPVILDAGDCQMVSNTLLGIAGLMQGFSAKLIVCLLAYYKFLVQDKRGTNVSKIREVLLKIAVLCPANLCSTPVFCSI